MCLSFDPPLLILASSPAWFSLKAATPDTTPLAPSKFLKSGASAMPHSVAQPPTGGPHELEAVTAKLWEALIRGAQRVQVQMGASGCSVGRRG